MRIECEILDCLLIAAFHGTCDGSAKESIDEALPLQECAHDLIVDLLKVDSIDSSGLGLLVRLVHRFRQNDRRCVLARPPAFAHSLMMISSIGSFVPVVDTIPEAIERIRSSDGTDEGCDSSATLDPS